MPGENCFVQTLYINAATATRTVCLSDTGQIPEINGEKMQFSI
jgi:hypothetical protein